MVKGGKLEYKKEGRMGGNGRETGGGGGVRGEGRMSSKRV